MGEIVLDSGRIIKDNGEPYIIAELNSSHDGKVETAKEMILSAIDCGCDCIKLQSYSTESLFAEEYYKNNRILKRFVQKFSLEESALKELAAFCREKGIDFSSTPYSEEEAAFLAGLEPAFIKISSMEVNNLPFLKYIAGLGKAMVLSTGMATYEEIERAVAAIEETGNRKLCILHCVSVYPADAGLIHLRNLIRLKEMFPSYPVGYSDHTIGIEVPAASIALGAAVIEKHFTLDHTKMGMENDMATEPEMMKAMVLACRNVYRAMGGEERVLSPEELEYAGKMRRSLVAARDISAGELLQEKDIVAKRPGTGIAPDHLQEIIGKKMKEDIKEGWLFRQEMLEDA